MNNNTSKIARNTLFLYIRMIFSMIVSLYTARVVLNTLGVVDYGIYNVVGGIISIFGFINGAMAVGTQRFLTLELGKNNPQQLRHVFNMSVMLHVLIAIIVFILAETAGLWFVNNELSIPDNRMAAANWVYQFSIFSTLIGIWSVPYNGIIIAREQMNVYAYISILEVLLRLFIVFMLQWFGADKLKFYAVLTFLIALIIRFIYGIYCRMNFIETKFRFYWDKNLYRSMINLSAWYLWGSVAGVASDQGINIILNIFFGPAINAARAIAYSVKNTVNSFVQSFQTALNPQIIKSFASGDLKYMHQLIFQGSKFSFFLLFFLSLPVLLQTEILLKIWLKTVPDYTILFTRLIIINIIIDSLSGPLMTGALASGKIKKYQFIMGSLLVMNLPVSYIFLQLDYKPEITLYISIVISLAALFIRIKILKSLIYLKISEFAKQVLLKAIIVVLISIILPLILNWVLGESKLKVLMVIFSAMTSVSLTVFFTGLTRNEKLFFFNLIRKNELFNSFKIASRNNNLLE